MSLINLFGKRESNFADVQDLPVINPTNEEVIEEKAPTEKSPSDTLTVTCATGWPIDIIYGLLNKRYEEQGYNDAIAKSDMTFMDINTNIIKNRILVAFKNVNLKYDVMKRNLESRIEICMSAGLITTQMELEREITIVNTHKEELQKLESDFVKGCNESSIPLQSYKCGFLRGVVAIALHAELTPISANVPKLA